MDHTIITSYNSSGIPSSSPLDIKLKSNLAGPSYLREPPEKHVNNNYVLMTRNSAEMEIERIFTTTEGTGARTRRGRASVAIRHPTMVQWLRIPGKDAQVK